MAHHSIRESTLESSLSCCALGGRRSLLEDSIKHAICSKLYCNEYICWSTWSLNEYTYFIFTTSIFSYELELESICLCILYCHRSRLPPSLNVCYVWSHQSFPSPHLNHKRWWSKYHRSNQLWILVMDPNHISHVRRHPIPTPHTCYFHLLIVKYFHLLIVDYIFTY